MKTGRGTEIFHKHRSESGDLDVAGLGRATFVTSPNMLITDLETAMKDDDFRFCNGGQTVHYNGGRRMENTNTMRKNKFECRRRRVSF